MPVTKGQGNPDWTWEETLLALELLYRHDGRAIAPTHPEAVQLSEELRAARIHSEESRKESFRNPDGVGLKLQNLMSAIDPTRRISSTRTDRAVVEEYPRSRTAELREACRAVRLAMDKDASADEFDDDETFIEGTHVTARHRKRDRRLRHRLIQSRIKDGLKCEICDFTPPAVGEELRTSFFEAHHDKPLADAEGERGTKVADMSLLCARCHRFLHRLIARKRRWVGVEEARSTYAAAVTSRGGLLPEGNRTLQRN